MQSKSILLVDDHVIVLRGLEHVFSPHYRVRVARTGKEALRLIEEEIPDLVISNILMPEMNGLELLQALQNSLRTRAIPFVFLTTQSDEDTRKRALLGGADDFILKTESVNYILLRIGCLLERIEIFRGGTPQKSATEALRVFVSYAREDESSARRIRELLRKNGVTAWLDVDDLIPGQEWETEIRRALRDSHLVLVCLSNKSITKRGYIQKEIRLALDLADEEPHGSIFVVPLKIEECPVPEPLVKWQWLNFFESDSETRLLDALRVRAETLGVLPPRGAVE